MNRKNDTWEEVIYEKYSDKDDERYGRVKHNNTIVQNIIDDFKSVLHERESAATQRAIDIAESMMKEVTNKPHGDSNAARRKKAYNRSLTDLITQLREWV